MTFTKGAGHDPRLLDQARQLVASSGAAGAARAVERLVAANEAWRGRGCVNLIAAESPTSPAARRLLSAEVGTRGSGGHIGETNRSFAGMRYIDELEAICVELLKTLFSAGHADHRLLGGMAGCVVAAGALAGHGDTVMSIPPRFGGDSSSRQDGPPGALGMRIVDIPFTPDGLAIDLEAFQATAERHRPRLVSLGQALTLFPLPVERLRSVVSPWGGRIYFDGAHQAGLIAGRRYPNPLDEGAAILTGSSGKTLSGPQGGVIAWNDDELTPVITQRIFPTLTGSHQVNRVAALAVTCAELLEYGPAYMGDTVENARALATALHERGFEVLGAGRGFTATHQILVDVRPFGTGYQVAAHLQEANIIVNRMLLPCDRDDDDAEPSGIRLGTVEVTRLGMGPDEMRTIATWMSRLLMERESPQAVRDEVIQLRDAFQTLYYCFEAGLPRRDEPPGQAATGLAGPPATPPDRGG